MTKYSIIIVTRNSAGVLFSCLESIVKVSMETDYEVIIVDNNSSDDSEALFSALEGDITILRNHYNAGFARAVNQGIAVAKGEFIVLLNPDTVVSDGWLDKLSHHFQSPDVGAVGPLSNYVAGLQKSELYSDEFLAFKSVESKLLIGFCLMIPRMVLKKIGALDDDLILGNEDLEFSLRLRENGYRLLVALDTFIYHKGHTAFEEESGSSRWVNFSSRVLEYKLRQRYKEISPRKLWGMEWFRPLPNETQDKVAIVIPTCNGLQYTKLCLESVRRCTFHPYEIIVVDNSSSDGTVEFLRGQSDVKLIINSENRGYPTACNQGIRASSAPYILLMNNDVVVTEGWLNRMFQAYFADAEVGLVGPRTNDCAGFQKMSAPHYETQSELEEFAQRMKRGAVRQFRQVDNLSGFCLLIDRKVVKKIGMLDERFGIGNYEDQDFCRRAERAGFKLFIANEVYVHHYGSRAFIENKFEYHKILEENRRKFEQKWEAVAV